MGVSVVVPTLNEERYVGSLLADLARQTLEPDEVLVVDGGSADGTVGVVGRFPEATLIRGPRNLAAQRNLGGESATGDVVAFVDADARLPEAFLERFVGEMDRRGLDAACPLYRPSGAAWPVGLFFGFANAVHVCLQGTRLAGGAGHCIVLRRSTFREVGGFDPSYRFDDVELIRRASRRHRYGIVGERIYVSDRRWRRDGFWRTASTYSALWLMFALGRFDWSNRVAYEMGGSGPHDLGPRRR